MKHRKYSAVLAMCAAALVLVITAPRAVAQNSTSVRERLLMDFGWKFALGHATDVAQDFNHSTAAFFFAKAGYGDGPAAASFDDRVWRQLDLPHDWVVELPFDRQGSGSHGFKAVGHRFPQNSIGWYRKSFTIPQSDLGKRISLEFDGVYRDSVVWINGHYLGNEHSGYSSFAYDVTPYLNYDGNNVVTVRVDATIEEGWFYEGGGIYRHVWMVKTDPLHVERYGTFVTTNVKDASADVSIQTIVTNERTEPATFDVEQMIVAPDGTAAANGQVKGATLQPGQSSDIPCTVAVNNPALWSLEAPNLYKSITTIRQGDKVIDRYETPFGIRTIRFDANEGFFLNGKHVRIYGTDNHQDHAGVGTAIPDALNEYRIARLKEFGINAYRTSHNPPTPEMLDACDRLGMLVLDEHRMMGISPQILDELKRLIRRDRNHPSVILWSLGNEEWAIEGNVTGERITQEMRAVVNRLDPTRKTTVASSGSWGRGTSARTEVMGFNYFVHGNTDQFHAQFPDRPSVGTEECATYSTRGIYVPDDPQAHKTAYDVNAPDWGAVASAGWMHYADRQYVAGMFIWTGFDYRGETTPYGWPAISSQFGILDTCGFPKDNAYYFKAQWTSTPMVHLLPHWNWPGKEGQEIDVWAHTNADEVELFLNGQSLGKKQVEKYSHAEWKVKYAPGTLLARAFKGGTEVATDKVETSGQAAAIALSANRTTINGDGEDCCVIAVQIQDAQGRSVATANNAVRFSITGPGKIIGVGNGNPSSHEPDNFVQTSGALPVASWRSRAVEQIDAAMLGADFDDSQWQAIGGRGGGAGGRRGQQNAPAAGAFTIYRATVQIENLNSANVALLLRSIGDSQSVYVNGKQIAKDLPRDNAGINVEGLEKELKPGKNVVAVVATQAAAGGARRGGGGGNRGGVGGGPGILRLTSAAPVWQRSAFNGLAQVIVQSTGPGEISLTANGDGLTQGTVKILAKQSPLRPAIR